MTHTDAALQRFRQAVYERFAPLPSEKDKKQSAVASIKQRTTYFLNWQSTTTQNHTPPTISDELLLHWIAADVTAFKDSVAAEQTTAASHIRGNFSVYPAYTEMLQKVNSEIAFLVTKLAPEDTEQQKSPHLDQSDTENLALTATQKINAEVTSDKKIVLNGFIFSNLTPNATPSEEGNIPPILPEQIVSKVLESVTHQALNDGSVLYLVNNRRAFIDHGEQILMESQADKDEEAILAAVLLAKEKYRGAFELTGTETFKRRAIEVMLKHNVDVRLKNPQQDALRRELAKTITPNTQDTPLPVHAAEHNSIVGSTSITEKDAPPTEVTPTLSHREPQKINHLAGKVIRHGEDYYAHDKNNKESYFITLENANGRQSTLWGVDLERVIDEKGIAVGDDICLESKGKKIVEVEQEVKNQAGEVIGTEIISTHRNEWDAKVLAKISPASDTINTSPNLDPALIPVRAHDWWTVQREAIHSWAKTDAELQADLTVLGPEPSMEHIFWFDKSVQQCVAPTHTENTLNTPSQAHNLASETNHELRQGATATSSHPLRGEVFSINLKDLDMTATHAEQEQNAILRGVRKLESGEFDTTVLLYKGKGDYLQGYIKIGGEKRQVIAHLNQRKPNEATGETKPNFLTLSEPHGSGDDTTWKEIGFGNAVNKRKDGKPVYFDEVLLSVDKEVFGARLTKHADDEMQRKLGFQEPRQKRPKFEAGNAGDVSPKPTASVANAQAVKAADAPQKQPRRNAPMAA
ncbi:MAG: hypothetical protein IT497_04740 [Ottowia sp.]|nr:hypothetical protein [Ottowia sp.]